MLDSMTAHLEDDVKSALKRVNSIPAVIPGGLMKLLQPLDISVNRSFKSKIREIWANWMEDREHSFTKTGQMRRAMYAGVCNWVVEA